MSCPVKVDTVCELLESSTLTECGVSFQGKTLKLNNEADCSIIVEAIEKCDKLEYLNLEGNTLGVDASKAIAKALESKPELKRALWKDIFTGRMKEEIPKALLNLGNGLTIAGAKLTELDLSDNAFGPIGVKALAGLLSSVTCFQLQQLRLNNNGLGISGGKMLSEALLQCYENSIKQGTTFALKVLIIGRNRLENEGALALSKVFETLGSLEEVALPQNGIYSQGIEALSKSFTKNPNLKVINLNDNTVTKTGAISISKALPHLQKLKILNLGDCLIKTSGAQVLAEALKRKHNDLEELYLCYNEIKNSGGLAIAEAMKNKNKMKQLSLSGNFFDNATQRSIEKIMRDNNRLESLALSENESENEVDEESDEEDENESDKSLNDSQTSNNSQEAINTSKNDSAGILADCLKNMTFGGRDVGSIINQFLASPTINNFGDIKKEVISDYIEAQLESSSLDFPGETLIPLIIKISALSSSSDEKVNALSLDITYDLYSKLFEWADRVNKISYVNNMLMSYLGLIKNEDKSYKITWDRQASLSALKTAISKNIVPEQTVSILNFCLEKK